MVCDPAAIAAMALLVDDRATIEPGGALAFACLLYLAGSHEAAQFWWQFTAGADSCTAPQCLYLHHLQHSELRDAHHWHTQAFARGHLGCDSMPPTTPSPAAHADASGFSWTHIRTMSVPTLFPTTASLSLSNSITEAAHRDPAPSEAWYQGPLHHDRVGYEPCLPLRQAADLVTQLIRCSR